MKSARFAEILHLLAEADVEVIIVGMMAGVLQGAPLTTGDVDILHRRTPENVQRLLGVLRKIRAVYRHDPRRLSPGESHLLGPGHQLLESQFGDLDCLGTIDDGKTYDDLIGFAAPIVVRPRSRNLDRGQAPRRPPQGHRRAARIASHARRTTARANLKKGQPAPSCILAGGRSHFDAFLHRPARFCTPGSHKVGGSIRARASGAE
jgi:hypothetical protein